MFQNVSYKVLNVSTDSLPDQPEKFREIIIGVFCLQAVCSCFEPEYFEECI